METTYLLDHGFVRMIDHMGSDLSIARNARVSYDADWRAGEDAGSDNRLIRYLYKNGHNTPFEAAVFTFEVKCPIFIARQWLRHRTWSYNEISARYAQLPNEMFVPDMHTIGVQSKDNKQMRELTVPFVSLSTEKQEELLKWVADVDDHNKSSYKLYERGLEIGVPRELSRGVLPLNIYTHFFATVDLHNLMHFLRLRLHEHAQYEIRVYANAMLELIRPIVPVAVAAFEGTRK